MFSSMMMGCGSSETESVTLTVVSSTTSESDTTFSMAIDETTNTLFIAYYGSSPFSSYDISDRENIVHLDNTSKSDKFMEVSIYSTNYAFVPEHVDKDISIVDISNTSDLIVDNTVSSGTVSGAIIVGEEYFTVSTNDVLKVFSITDNGRTLTETGSIKDGVNLDRTRGVTSKHAGYVFAVGDGGYVTSVDVSDPSNMTIGSKLNLNSDGHAYNAVMFNNSNYLICTQRGDGVTIVDIDDPLNMVEVSNLSDIGDCFDLKINADDSRVFVAGNNTLYVIDISNVTNPTLLGTLDGLSSEVFSLAVIDNYIYTVSDADLLCVRID